MPSLLLSLNLSVLGLAGCDGSASSQSGIAALVHVTNGQFVPGAMPAATGGPLVTGVDSLNNTIRPGQRNKKLSGRLAKGGGAVAIGFAGDAGYYTVAAGAEDILNPGELTFDASVSFSPALSIGKHDLLFRAVDAGGNFGPPDPLVLESRLPIPEGDLVVSLDWDSEADLDLHVVPPAGSEVWARKINSYQPAPGEMPDPAKAAAGGYLDFDSNSQCQIDGRRQENVLWKTLAPAGHYSVRVDAFSLCGEPGARWNLEVLHQGVSVGKASGFAGEGDTRMHHEAGSGVLALEFDL